MKVAFDLRPLQIGHQYRGIGICLQNILNQLQNHTNNINHNHWDLVFYVYKNHPLPDILSNYTVPHRIISIQEIVPSGSRFKLLRYLKFLYTSWRKVNSINSLPEIGNMDVFVQFDFLLGIPTKPKVRSVLLKYDIIPLVLETYYLPTFGQTRARTKNVKHAIKSQLYRARYLWSLRKSLGAADHVLAISEHTKRDLVSYLSIDEQKIEVLPLAADDLTPNSLQKSKSNSLWTLDWRFIPAQRRYAQYFITDRPYLLFIGGADQRRRIQDLVLAYNILRSEGIDCSLILAGYDFKDLEKIPNKDIQESLKYSSYGDDIHLFGFITSEEKSLLYQNATAFVYPTIYEGFGLPILEAMQQGCPVVCYNNSSLVEVGGKAALYAGKPEDIANIVKDLLADDNLRRKMIKLGRKQSKKFSWQKTTAKFVEIIETLTLNG